MTFELRPILSEMKAFYQEPISPTRFQQYMLILQGDKNNDIKLPISGYNPMAQDHIITKIDALQSIGAEEIMSRCISDINSQLAIKGNIKIQVVLNIADDLKGGWTHRYATDYDSKYKIHALVERGYCAPYCWTSEEYTPELIISRTKAYCYYTVYWLDHGRPHTLADHVEQEVWVTRQSASTREVRPQMSHTQLQDYYDQHHLSDDYGRIFNFLYGDLASRSLGYPEYGIDGTQLSSFIMAMSGR